MHTIHQIQSLKELVDNFFETSPFQKQITTAMVRSVWYKIMPKVVCNRTEKIYIHNEKLFVTITSAALRYELQFSKNKIMTLLKEAMPKTFFQDIVIL